MLYCWDIFMNPERNETMTLENPVRRHSTIRYMLSFLAAAILEAGAAQVPDHLRSAEDDVCTITACTEKQADGAIQVDFTLRPEPDSDIRCRIHLPPSDRWNGTFWGLGTSSYGGSVADPLKEGIEKDEAAVTSDLGTARYVHGDRKGRHMPDAVMHDLYWRATHLMTVYGKKIVHAYYGKKHTRAYFRGGSRGAIQGLSEAMRFPGDYDGIILGVPAAMTAGTSAHVLNLHRQTHDDAGRPLVTREQLRILADAPIEYMKDRDPKPYAGKILANPFFTEADIDGFLALAAEKDPALGEPSLKARLKKIYTGVTRDGRTVCHGYLPGTFFGFKRGRSFKSNGGMLLDHRYRRIGSYSTATWDEYEDTCETLAPFTNASSFDLAAFRDRGGKLIISAGLEDQTTPCTDTVAWYDMLTERMGGPEATRKFCRLFLLPGHAHGGGKGRISCGCGFGKPHCEMLERWVEKDIAPETFPYRWQAEKITLPIPPYPLMCYLDDREKWRTRPLPAGRVRRPDPRYFRTTLTPWDFRLPAAACGGR